jgi:hypothetical protein
VILEDNLVENLLRILFSGREIFGNVMKDCDLLGRLHWNGD